MIQEDEYTQVLMKLGLTFLQAKTYLTLVRFERADVRTIFRASNIARQDVYRVMPTLEKQGLAQEIIGKPTMYKATPMKQGYHLLLESKKQRHLELQRNAMKVINSLDESNNFKPTPEDVKPQFVINYSEELLAKWFHEITNSVQTNLDVMCKWKFLRFKLFNEGQNFRGVVGRNVKIRIITEKRENDKSVQKIVENLRQNPLFEMRFLFEPLPVEMTISDETEGGLCTAPPPDNRGVPCLWSNQPQFLKVLSGYFESMWEKADQ